MILQKYRFEIHDTRQGSAPVVVHPVYKEIKIEDTKDAQNMFFRKTINGDLTFLGADYRYLISHTPSDIFFIDIIRDGNREVRGVFRYVEMDIDRNKESIRVGIRTIDGYSKISANLETEYDLVKLKPDLVNAKYSLSNCLQMTTAFSPTITNVYRRNIVTKDSTITDPQELTSGGFTPWYTVSTAWVDTLRTEGVRVLSKNTLEKHLDPPSPQNYDKIQPVQDKTNPERPIMYRAYVKIYYYSEFEVEKGGVKRAYRVALHLNYLDLRTPVTTYTMFLEALPSGSGEGIREYFLAGDRLVYPWNGSDCEISTLLSGELSNKEWANVYHPNGNIDMRIGTFYYNYIYGRLLSRASLSSGRAINEETDLDIFSNYYKYLRAYPVSGGIKTSVRFSKSATEYGIAYKEGSGDTAEVYYYDTPDDTAKYEPFLQSEWSDGWSLWINKSYIFNMFQSTNTEVQNSNFCEIGSAIKALLREIDPSVLFDSTEEFSEFLYADTGFRLNSLSSISVNRRCRILITQKSNTNKPNSDYYAMKAPVTLGSILDLLRESLNVYWFIDEENRFRLEHFRWFWNNGTYTSNHPSLDLSGYFDKFNKKPFSFMTNKYSYDLTKEYTRRRINWQEETTEAFGQGDVVMLDTYDDSNKMQEGNVNQFTPDIEYCGVFGKDTSNDGFTAVLAVEMEKYEYVVPEVQGIVNGDFATINLFKKWLRYGLPSKQFKIDKDVVFPSSLPSLTRKNSVSIPSTIRIDNKYTTILTEVGRGHIVKISKNIDTDYVTIELMYERE